MRAPYQGENDTDRSALAYFERSREKDLMHPRTKQELAYVLTMLAEKGEKENFRYLKEEVLAGKPWPWIRYNKLRKLKTA